MEEKPMDPRDEPQTTGSEVTEPQEGFHLTYGKQVMCGEANAVNTVDHFSYAIASRASKVGVCKSCEAALWQMR